MSKYTKAHCDRVIALGREGYHHEEIASELGVTRKTLYNWRKAHPEFDQSMELADTHSTAWHMGLFRRYTMGAVKDFNPTGWIFTMKNKAGWTDKIEQRIEQDTVLSLDDRSQVEEELLKHGIDPSQL